MIIFFFNLLEEKAKWTQTLAFFVCS